MRELNPELLATAQTVLSKKQFIGYRWEYTVQQFLSELGIHLDDANPLNPEIWKRETKKRPIDIETGTLRIECKWNNTKVYPAWIWKNIIKRFSTSTKMNIVLTNNKANFYHYSESLEAMKIAKIELMDIKDLEYYLKTPSFISIYNFIRRNVDGIILVSVKSIETLVECFKRPLNLRNTGSVQRVSRLKESLTSDFAGLKNDSLNDSTIAFSTRRNHSLFSTRRKVMLIHSMRKHVKSNLTTMKIVQWKQNSPWLGTQPWLPGQP